MPLEKLNRDIHSPNPSDELKKRMDLSGNIDASISQQKPENPFLQEESWKKEKKGLTDKQKKILKISLGVFGGLVLIVGLWVTIYNIRKNAFNEDRVFVSIDGPKEADSAQSVKYFIKYKNANRAKLSNAEITLNYSENFQIDGSGNVNLKQLNINNSKIYIGDIKAGEEGQVEISGVFYAPKDSLVYLYAYLKYSPSNLSSEFETKNQLGINISTSPLFLEIAGPIEASEGDNVEYVIDYKNLDVRALNDAQIKVDYPEGFDVIFSDPTPSQGNNIWYFGVLEPNAGGKIRISGKISGLSGQDKSINVRLGKSGGDGGLVVYNERERITRMVESSLVIYHEVENNPGLTVNPGDTLIYVIKYKNKGQYLLKDVIVSLDIDGRILDFEKVKSGSGHLDTETGVVTWKASDFPQLASLAPNEEGEIRFSVPILSVIPVAGVNDRNFIVSSVAKIDSSNLLNPSGLSKVVSSNKLDVKLNSKAVFDVEGFYVDPNMANFGTLPLVVGKETNFSLHWSVVNVSNDINDAMVISSLPSGVRWTGRIYPTGEKISYNERTNEIIWEAGTVKAGTGITSPKKEVIFQVSVTPQSNQVGDELKLLGISRLSAKDSFTGNEIVLSGREKTTQLQEDKTINPEYYKVVGQ